MERRHQLCAANRVAAGCFPCRIALAAGPATAARWRDVSARRLLLRCVGGYPGSFALLRGGYCERALARAGYVPGTARG